MNLASNRARQAASKPALTSAFLEYEVRDSSYVQDIYEIAFARCCSFHIICVPLSALVFTELSMVTCIQRNATHAYTWSPIECLVSLVS